MNPLIELYRHHLHAQHLVPLTVKTRIQHIERFFTWVRTSQTDGADIRDITLRQLQDYHDYLVTSSGMYGRPVTPGYRHAQIHAVTGFYAFLKQRKKIVINPFAEFPKLRKSHRLPKGVITNAQVLSWLAQPDVSTPLGYRDRTIMEVLYSTGLRGMELCNLTPYDLDLKERTLRVNQGKGRKDRVVPIGKIAIGYVSEYLTRVRPILLDRVRGKSAVSHLFLSEHSTPLRTCVLRRILMRHRAAAGLPNSVTVHSLRHACATEMLKGGASVRHIQEMLGHAHLSTTQIYTRVVPSDLKRVHQATAPSERRRVIDVPTFKLRGWRDKKNAGRINKR